MSADLLSLPDRVPDGWEPSSMFAGAWIRKVSTVRGLRPEDAVYEVHGPKAIVLLVVEETEDGYTASANHAPAGTWPDRWMACIAAERVYCNAAVRP